MNLEDYGVEVGDPCRFRPRPNARWQTGRILGVSKDGAVHVSGNGFRTFPIDRIEIKTYGPKGGVHWQVPVPVTRSAPES